MSTEIVTYEPQSVTLSNEQLQYIASTEFVPVGLRGNLPAILACVATGRALGLPDMTALRSIHIIDGKATFSAELMVMLVRRQGHSITGEVAQGGAVATGKRADNGDTITVTWTLEMAERAGLLGKSNWKKYPESMLWARAVSQLSRMLFADCMGGGATYTPEELEAIEGSTGEPSGAAAPPTPPDLLGGNAGQASSPVDDPAHGTPFTDGDEPVEPPGGDTKRKPTKNQLDALTKLVKQLEGAGHITTLQVWQSVGIEPTLDDHDEDRLRWTPLRDQLTRAQASQLLDRLIPFAKDKLGEAA